MKRSLFLLVCLVTLVCLSVSAMLLAGQGQLHQTKATSSLAYAIKFGDGKITADIAIPKEHLAEVIAPMMTSFASQLSNLNGGAKGNIDMNSLK